MKTVVVKMYHDAGHEWIAVKRKTLIELGVMSKISSYSYQNGGTVYLECDCDAKPYLDSLKANGVELFIKSSYTERSPIRSYYPFKNVEGSK